MPKREKKNKKTNPGREIRFCYIFSLGSLRGNLWVSSNNHLFLLQSDEIRRNSAELCLIRKF